MKQRVLFLIIIIIVMMILSCDGWEWGDGPICPAEDEPITVTLISPADGVTVTTVTPTFEWEADGTASVYHLMIDDDEDFGSPVVDKDDISGTSYTLSGIGGEYLESGITYYWKVRAQDSGGTWWDWSYDPPWDFDIALNQSWVMTIGGTGSDRPTNITIDSNNIYVIGGFSDTVDFNSGIGEDYKTVTNGSGIFITKYDSNGNYCWTNSIERDGDFYTGYRYGIEVDNNQNFYIANRFINTIDFDPGPGIDSFTCSGEHDIFFSKYGIDGSYQWTKIISGNYHKGINALTIDNNDSLIFTGNFYDSVDFDPSVGSDIKTSSIGESIFISKYNNLENYMWTAVFLATASPGYQVPYDIKTDSYNNIISCGNYEYGIDFDPYAGTDIRGSSWGDGYVTKLNNNETYGWTQTWGGSGVEYVMSIAIDESNNIYVTGCNDGGLSSKCDLIIKKFNETGTIIWEKSLSNNDGSFGYDIIYDDSNKLYVVGDFEGTVDFDPTTNVDNKTALGPNDFFISVYNTDGTYLGTKILGGSGTDNGQISIEIDSNQNLYIVGSFEETVDFDLGSGIDERTSNGDKDIFIMKVPASIIEN